MNEWLSIAPNAQAVCSFVGAMVSVNDFAERPARARLKFLATPHFPHGWDAGSPLRRSDKTLLCSDLFFHPGDPEPFTEMDVVGRAETSIAEGMKGPLAHDMPYTPYTDATLRRLADLEPNTLAFTAWIHFPWRWSEGDLGAGGSD